MKIFQKFISVALSFAILLGANTIIVNSTEKTKSVYLGGESFGIKFYTNGVMIIELESYYDGKEYKCPAKDGGLMVNDVIKEVNGNKINSNEDLQRVTVHCDGNPIEVTVERNGKSYNKTVKPIKNTAGMYLIGAWVRDSCAGIGTVTYYDVDKNYFAALGHGVCDSDTSALMPLGTGEAVRADISGVTKSVAGKTGSLDGYFTDNVLGKLTKNSDIGIYGTISDNFNFNKQKVEVAKNSEVKTGKATVYTILKNNEVGCYNIEINKICNDSANSNENFVIKITSDELLKKCGGIVQGMSGSPIVQDGKLVGAVTHVFVNTPNEGYGILAQNMELNYEN